MEFLTYLRQQGKSVWLVTNAHGKTLAIKMKKTLLGPGSPASSPPTISAFRRKRRILGKAPGTGPL